MIRTTMNAAETWQDSTGGSEPTWLAKLSGQGAETISTGRNIGGTRAASESLLKASLLNPDEIARHFAREAGNLLALIPHPDYPPFALNRCAYFSAADDGLFDGVPGKSNPATSASQRIARDARAARSSSTGSPS